MQRRREAIIGQGGPAPLADRLGEESEKSCGAAVVAGAGPAAVAEGEVRSRFALVLSQES